MTNKPTTLLSEIERGIESALYVFVEVPPSTTFERGYFYALMELAANTNVITTPTFKNALHLLSEEAVVNYTIRRNQALKA